MAVASARKGSAPSQFTGNRLQSTRVLLFHIIVVIEMVLACSSHGQLVNALSHLSEGHNEILEYNFVGFVSLHERRVDGKSVWIQ